MDPIESWLEIFFAKTNSLQQYLSKEWRENINRRSLAFIVGVGIVAVLLYIFIIQPPVHFPSDQIVTVPQGASLDSISQTLYEDGVVRNAFALKMLVAILGRERGVYAGDYEFKQPENIFSIAYALSVGEYGLVPVKIRIPEGATMKEMALIYSQELPRFNSANFLAQTDTDEGYLFPDTYFFLPDATESTVIEAMRQDFDGQIASIEPIIASSTHSLSDIVTMASLIEDEAPDTQDRMMIAGILWRRIALGQSLQVDSTIIYAIGIPDSQLTIQDLQSDSPYNTYTRKGLPPTPIGAPSLDSIEAAAEATSSPYLYYLADKNGVTHYAKTYAQQLRNERIYLGT